MKSDTIPAPPPVDPITDSLSAMAERMRGCGVLEVEFAPKSIPWHTPEIIRIKLDPTWVAPKLPEEEPTFDANPHANAIALAAYRSKRDAEQKAKEQALADRLTFAHTEGFPET